MWTAPLNVVRFGATTLWHLDAEERAPSTTSGTTDSRSPRDVRFSPASNRIAASRQASPEPDLVIGA
jgi:hypothetical protein